jgi:hypothetical protein
MKQYTNLIFSIVFATMMGSCDYLDYDEKSYLLKEDIFEEFTRTKKFLTNIYSKLPHDFNTVSGAMRSSGTDEAIHVNSLSNIIRFTDGSWSPLQTIDTQWGNMYSGIYSANIFLKEAEGKIWTELQWNQDYDEIIEQFSLYSYEARFLRAYFYFELYRRYGGVPIVTTELTPEEANNVERATAEEVVNFIVAECDAVMSELPVTYVGLSSVSETGRATKGAAMALKARALLYNASPLHNPSNEILKWENAASASHDIIDANLYTLETSYSNVVNNGTSTELIYSVRQGESVGFERANFPVGYEGGNTGTCPTNNLVNAYEMEDTGLPISDPNSGYDPIFPYLGRDARLKETVILNGSIFKSRLVELWYGGANAEPKPNASLTGYYLKKYVVESVNLNPVSNKRHEWVLFRMGEVYLNYAEAMNHAMGGPEVAGTFTMTALDAVNMVRARAGMPAFPSGMSQADFNTKLQNERRIELAFEDHRFWDVRRWKIAPETEIKGVSVVRNAFGGYLYQEIDVETRIWDQKMNLYPIPENEGFNNEKLVQNPGW